VDEEKQPEHDDNAQTIRPTNRFPRSAPGAISKSPPREIGPIPTWASIRTTSDWQEKFTDFKMKTSVRRGLFHPNDIKTVGLAPSPLSAVTRRKWARTQPCAVAPAECDHSVIRNAIHDVFPNALALALSFLCGFLQRLYREIGCTEGGQPRVQQVRRGRR
jgi:hypothetical protein